MSFTQTRFSYGLCSAATVVLVAILASPARAQTVTAPDYVYSNIQRTVRTEPCVAAAQGGTFVGSVGGNTQSVVFLADSGAERIVVLGLNGIGDCAYDQSHDILYVTDNGILGTVVKIDDASTATNVPATGHNLLPLGDIAGAASIALDRNGNIFVSDPVAGIVTKILFGGAASTFETLPGVAGLAWQPLDADSELLLAAWDLGTGQTKVNRYRATGGLPFDSVTSDEFGPLDLATTPDGNAVATNSFNGPIVAIDFAAADPTTVVANGFTQATSIDVDDFTGRIALVSTTGDTPPAAEDKRLHFLTPIDRLATGHIRDESDRRECLLEVYGVEPALDKNGVPTKRALCTDGAPCDADGTVDGKCTFPVGVCLNVVDPRLPNCSSLGTTYFELQQAKPESVELKALEGRIVSSLKANGDVLVDPQCFFTDGVEVPLRVTKSGDTRDGKQKVKFQSKAEIPKGDKQTSQIELDTVKLVCEPPA